MASVMSSHQNRISSPRSVGHICVQLILVAGINYLASKDLGVTLIFAAIFIGMFIAGGVSMWWTALGFGALAAAFPILWNFFFSDEQKNRILVIFMPEVIDPTGLDERWHTTQSLNSLTGGGMLGQGLFSHNILVYLGVAIALGMWWYLNRTTPGLKLRAVGENPGAADSVGINVYKMRYIGTIISGCLAAFGGFIYALSAAGCTSNGDVAGLGFLALAVMIFGNWKPIPIALAALLFGALKCISVGYAYIDFNNDNVYALANLGISSHLYRILPYIITLIVLAFTSKKSRAPKAEGQPYDKGKR